MRKLYALRYELDPEAYENRAPYRPDHLALVERWLDYVAELVAGDCEDFGLEVSIAKL